MFRLKEPHFGSANNYNLSEIALRSGFKFRDIENRRLDWKTLGCVDVNKVIENQDYEFLEKITPKIIEAPMQSILGTAAIDPAVSSLFRLAQMSLQYLSFCQQFMSHTLFDLRTAFNQLQKKYSNLKQNYKCLEEQHYKAQEKIQSLINGKIGEFNTKTVENVDSSVKPSALFPCDKCTKNFVTLESLKSHQQRKHHIIEEKHESSDDNEKNSDQTHFRSPMAEDLQNTAKLPMSSVEIESAKNNGKNSPSNNNNNDNESNANCTVCSQKTQINSSSIAIQCEVTNIGSPETPHKPEELETRKDGSEKCNPNESDSKEYVKKLDDELVRSAHETINDLKKQIADLRNSLEAKNSAESQSILASADKSKDANLVETNDKIDVIEQKFNAFETMYMESQNQFIESFRSLDERQKIYMDSIQETIKEIVENSLGQKNTIAADKTPVTELHTDIKCSSENEAKRSLHSDRYNESSDEVNEEVKKDKVTIEKCSYAKPHISDQSEIIDSSSQSDMEQGSMTQGQENQGKLICQADIHTISQVETKDFHQENFKSSREKTKTKSKIPINKVTKDIAINKFEQRLRQFGVDADSTGLTTPRSFEVNQDLADEREEMKKVHNSFGMTRKKLRSEVDRIAKRKLTSASSVTSLSSTPYQSDDQRDNSQNIQLTKIRPKSASVQKMRKRNAKKLMRKFVENDIDESDIMDKMQMAQKAINAHRECIQELLQTTAHSPSSFNKVKNPSSPRDGKIKFKNDAPNPEISTNQYNKMPNITTRRVVFVNLNEDS